MKDFNDFLEFLAIPEIENKVVFDATKTIGTVSADKQTMTGDEWDLIGKYVVKANFALLRQYHEWLSKQLQDNDSI